MLHERSLTKGCQNNMVKDKHTCVAQVMHRHDACVLILQDGPDGVVVPLVKLFEFLVASMCLFLVPEGDGDPLHANEVRGALSSRSLCLALSPCLCFSLPPSYVFSLSLSLSVSVCVCVRVCTCEDFRQSDYFTTRYSPQALARHV
jgi:hypothetical protein